MTTKEYEDYLQSIGMPNLTIDELIASFIDEAEERQTDNNKRFNKAYDEFNCKGTKSEWKIDRQTNQAVTFINNLNYFETSGISISLYNDVLSLVGPFDIFSNYYTFQNEISSQSREYYHNYFKSVLAAFKSDFILYAHEWSGMIDEEDDNLSGSKILEAVSSRISENSSLHDMNSFYFEKLKPKSSSFK
jgi:hypothetical protein